MKLRLFSVIVLISFITINFSINAQESIIPTDSTHRLLKVEKNTLDYAQKVLNKQSNKIALPLEINLFLEDSLNTEPHNVTPKWDQSFFVRQPDVVSTLIVPLTPLTSNKVDAIQSVLIITCDKERNFYRIISTQINDIRNDSINTEIFVNSNLDGLFLNAELYRNGIKEKEISGISQTFGVYDKIYDNTPNHKSYAKTTNERLNRIFFNADSRTTWQKEMGEAVINSLWGTPHKWIITKAKHY